ncbi:MAG: TPM domain-containing protein [Erysipelotrichaceae bacterium]|nr:TPM domain-containing protein [Erysipelotrichaceae bacterium]
MKRLFRILLVAMLMLLATNRINAEDDHIILDDNYVQDHYDELNDDLKHIEEDYDIGIYFVLDKSINDVDAYAKSFLETHSHATSNVVMVVSEDNYAIATNGYYANDVNSYRKELWNRYNDAPTYTDGIRDYYQAVTAIVNANQYSSVVPKVSGTPSVYDEAGLLTGEQTKQLKEKIDEIRKKYGMDVVVVTTNDLKGAKAMDYADDFYDYNGYGKDGVLMLLSMDDRGWHVSTKGKGAKYFTDYGIDVIVDKMMSNLKKGNFYEAFTIFADQADYFIDQGRQGNIIDTNNPVKKEKTFGIFNGAISAVVGALSSLFTSLILNGQMKSIKMEKYAGSYVVDRSFVINGSADMLVDTKISRHYDPPHHESSSHSSSGGGSSMHTSSSGSSHGGHGGHF